MPSALETLVKILKLEREQGYKDTAVTGGLSNYVDSWTEQAHTQARIAEHHALVDEIQGRLRNYQAVSARDERHQLVQQTLDRIFKKQSPPPGFEERVAYYAARMAAAPPPAPVTQAEEEPARRERERPAPRDAKENRSRRAGREADASQNRAEGEADRNADRDTARDTARDANREDVSEAENGASAATRTDPRERQDNRPRHEDTRERPERRPETRQNEPQNAADDRNASKARPSNKRGGTGGERESRPPASAPARGGGGYRPEGIRNDPANEHSNLEFEIEGLTAGRLDIPLPTRLARPPRHARPVLDPDEATDLLHGLSAPVSTLKGIGEANSELLAKLGIQTIQDLLFYLPRRYDDYMTMSNISQLQPDTMATVIGTIQSAEMRIARGSRKDFFMVVDDGSAAIQVLFFGQHFLNRTLKAGQQILLHGKASFSLRRMQMINPEWEFVEIEDLKNPGIVPIYGLTEGLRNKALRRLIKRAVDYWAEHLPDYVPVATLDRVGLADLGWTLQNLHFPQSWDHLEHARRRYIFDQLLLLQLTILANRRAWQQVPGIALPVGDGELDAFVAAVFPYTLTGAQQRAIHDIRRDIAQPIPMNRLLQGDVGSGKTAVAFTAMAMAFMSGRQSAIMAPTSILTEQHYRNLTRMMESFPAERKPRIGLLTGALPAAERNAVLRGLADGSIDMVVGTHALIQNGVEFSDLAVAVIDEQHRFGVEQRGALRGKGTNPHLLVMTATPIPRTLALTLYADLDLSIIDEMPPGRIPVKTHVIEPIARERAYNWIEETFLQEGQQAFVVYPLVEASERIEAENAIDAHKKLTQVFYKYKVGLLHGRMKAAEKDAVMADFRERRFDVLVTTSVAEVGVDIPNASVILIESANRFGLAQLHQFRGRVGRGGMESVCLLLCDTQDRAARERLEVLKVVSDGFRLAEADWRLRGAGDLIGTRQSGQNRLQLVDEMTPELVETAQREARTLYEEDPELQLPTHRLLAERVRLLRDERSDLS